MKPAFALCTVVSALLLIASTALAQDLGSDEVTLKNGGSVRGTVVSVEPGTKVVILELGQKEPRTIPWAEVADVEKGKYAPAQGGEPQPGPAGPGYDEPDRAPPGGDAPDPNKGVEVRIESDRPVFLIEHLGSSVVQAGRYTVAIEHGRVACDSPCNRKIDGSKGQSFLITGDGVESSEPFTLSGREGPTTLVVDPGSTKVRVGGVWLAVFGGTFTGVGALTLGLGFGLDGDRDLSNIMKISGGVSLGVGLSMLAAGIPMIVTQDTSVDVIDTASETALDWNAESTSYRPRARAPRFWAGEF